MDFQATLTKTFRSRKLYYFVAAVAFAAVLPLFVRSQYLVGQVFTLMIIFAIYASSWNLLAYSGQGSLGHAAFLGIGGFASALIAANMGLPPIVGLFLSGLMSAGIGFLIGLACVRLKAWFLAMVTFGFSVIVVAIINQFDAFFGGVNGFQTVPIAPQTLPFYYATLTIAAASIAVIFLVMQSKLGLAFKAIRENEQEAKMIGINTGKYRLLAFAISTFFAGLAGGLYAESQLFIQISIFQPYNSFLPLIMSVIGGLSTIEGPIIGSVVIVTINSYLPTADKYLQPLGSLFPGAANSVGSALGHVGLGLFLIVVVIFLPKGLASPLHRFFNYMLSLIHKLYNYLREGETKKGEKK
jgi:branched-chain amino acid transport system permease protein